MKLIDDGDRRANTPEYGVSEISGSIKNILENEFGRVRVRGELGRVFVARSGHVYYDLKDENSVLSVVTFKGQMSGLSISPEEGLEVVATGKLTTFGTQSKYQLVVDELRVSGVGSLMAMLEKRKKMLDKEGLFDQDKKKKIPYIPELIGVITSPQGAVISDILHRLRDRFPRKVLIWPVTVQGDSCAKQVSQAIIGFNSLPSDGELRRPDLLIVARGGGSIEDLWGFNEEIVVRAAAISEIPIISAVGHETDTTLIDYVSDIRAPTPTAAAEMAVPVRRDLIFDLNGLGVRLNTTIIRTLELREKRIRDLFRVISRPDDFVMAVSKKLLNLTDKLPKALNVSVQSKRLKSERVLSGFSPNLLKHGILTVRKSLEHQVYLFNFLVDNQTPSIRRGFENLCKRLGRKRLSEQLEMSDQRFKRLKRNFEYIAVGQIEEKSKRLNYLEQLLKTLSYHKTLERGYAVVWSEERIVSSLSEAKKEKHLTIEFKDGKHLL